MEKQMSFLKKKYGLPASYRIKRKKIFDLLFSEGESLFVYPFKLIYVRTELPGGVPYQAAFAVSKKKFKKAVLRNRVKRLMREVFRLNSGQLEGVQNLAILFIYVSNREESFDFLQRQMKELLKKLIEKTQKDGPA
jgi:ribonuclease P protein component